MQASAQLNKICATCGRGMNWRKKWEKTWASIIYCSSSCRKHKIKPNSLDTLFESKILSLLSTRHTLLGPAALVTCEEAENEVLREQASKTKQPLEDPTLGAQEMTPPLRTRERCRQAARRLAARGKVLVMQDGKAVDPSFAKGFMELKLPI